MRINKLKMDTRSSPERQTHTCHPTWSGRVRLWRQLGQDTPRARGFVNAAARERAPRG